VTISPAQHYDISERFRILSPSRVVTIPLGLHLDRLLRLGPQAPSYRRSLAIPPGDVVIGYVGRMVPIKALPMLVTAFVAAVRHRPDTWLLLVGDGPARGEIEAMVAKAGIGARVRFTGWSEDLPRVYATMDICALSSLNEGTPVAIIEALAAGRAVAATSVGRVPDLIDDGTNGLLVPPGAAPALATAILRLTDDAQLRRRFGDAGRRLVTARYASDRLVTDVEKLYLSALAGKRRNTRPDDAADDGSGIILDY
jgi:glycosyltransferase involved in cell wall biosynthesis